MNSIQVFALVRQLLTIGGAVISANGYASAAQVETLTGAVVAIGSVVWSLYASRKDRLVSKVAGLPEVESVVLTNSQKGVDLGDKVNKSNVGQ